MITAASIYRSHFVYMLPNLVEAHGRLKSIRNHERHRDVRYNVPSEDSIEIHLVGVRNGSVVL